MKPIINNKRRPGSGSEHKVLKSVFSIKEICLLDIIGKGIANKKIYTYMCSEYCMQSSMILF